jgi:DNA polymerase-1
MSESPSPKFDRILVDGDILLYGVCSACEYSARFDDDLDVVFSNSAEAKGMIDAAMELYKEKFSTDKIIIAFSGSNNFRKVIYPEYKAHRKKVRKPCGYRQIRDELSAKYHTWMEPSLEADDVLGILQGDCIQRGKMSIIVSSDKDFNTIAGWRYNPDNDKMIYTEARAADRNWLAQTLTGDKTDGYPGLEGVGPVTAEKILKEGIWEEVSAAYRDKGYTEEFAVTMGRCARILRSNEYDFDKKEVRLWLPPVTL